MKFATDLDEVLSRTNDGILEFSNPRYGLSLAREQIFSHDWSKVWGCSMEEATRRWHKFEDDPSFKELKPYEGSVEAIDYLKRMGNELYVITGREIFLEEMTNEWIKRYYPNKFSGVFFAKHPYVKTERKTKADFCKELNVDMFVDDDANYAKMCATVVTNVLLYKQEWNKNVDMPKNVHPVGSWPEIVDFVKNLPI